VYCNSVAIFYFLVWFLDCCFCLSLDLVVSFRFVVGLLILRVCEVGCYIVGFCLCLCFACFDFACVGCGLIADCCVS